MYYYNLKLAVMLKHDINYENTYETISNFIAYAMLQDEELKEMHERNEYKDYVFCSLYPLEKEHIYKENQIYAFDLRSINLNFILKMKQLLSITKNSNFKFIMGNIETSSQRPIKSLFTLTPAIVTTDKGDYLIKDDLKLVRKRINDNAQKKYKNFFKEEINIDFVNEIKQTNIKPVKIPYKNISLLGNKFEITVKEDKESQKLAYLCLAEGILEKNAQGFGFCKAK